MSRTSRIVFFMLIWSSFAAYTGWKWVSYEPVPVMSRKVSQDWDSIGFDESIIKEGDLILRDGKGFISELLKECNAQDKSFSHAGVATIENGQVFVIHAIGGEGNVSNKMLKDPLELFCWDKQCFAFGVAELNLPDSARTAFLSEVKHYYETGMEFDTDFDLSTDDRMYCSEMIYKSICVATNDKNFIPLTHVNGKPFVGVDNLYINQHSNLKFKHTYD